MRLLSQSSLRFILISTIALVLSIPLCFFTIRELLQKKIDEELIEHREEFRHTIGEIQTEQDLRFYRLLTHEFSLSPWPDKEHLNVRDTIFDRVTMDPHDSEQVPSRVLQSQVKILGKPYLLEIRESLIGTQELVGRLVWVVSGLLVSLVVTIVYVNYRSNRKMWGPFYSVLQKLQDFELEKTSRIELPQTSVREFADLNKAIDALVERSYRAYQSQKEFAENASHELQTPLAICRSKLELLLQTKGLTAEQATLIESLFAATDRLTRLNRNLLLLTKIENRQFPDLESVLPGGIIRNLLLNYQDQADKKRLHINLSLDQNQIECNRALMEVLLSNLFLNALRYTPDNGEVEVIQRGRQLEFINTGQPFNEPGKMFDRFSRESPGGQGSGLGLAIVKRICEVNGFSIQYQYDGIKHHFVVTF